MTWGYQQSTGYITYNGTLQSIGYSGTGTGRNNPASQEIHDVGPIPQGTYTIGQSYDDPGGKGPCVMPLIPDPADNMFGRSGFLIHGNNIQNDASHGCIIAAPAIRRLISESDDRILIVTP